MGLLCHVDSNNEQSLCPQVGVCLVAHQFHFQLAHSQRFNFKVLIKSKVTGFFFLLFFIGVLKASSPQGKVEKSSEFFTRADIKCNRLWQIKANVPQKYLENKTHFSSTT